jgi:hypothetical protein
MASNFDFDSKYIKSREFLSAGTKLSEAGHFREATVMFWIAVRDRIFGWLEKNEIAFSDTRSALLSAICHLDSEEARTAVVCLYTWGVIAEWDESVDVTQTQAAEYKRASECLIGNLS